MFAVMANINVTTEDRGTLTVPRPLYEWPLIRMTYQARGGSADVDPKWLYHPASKKPTTKREIDLTRSTIRLEMSRLQKSYTRLTAGGNYSLFDKVFGTGINNRFVKVVAAQSLAWKALDKKMKAETPVRYAPTADELLAIADLANPVLEGEPDIVRILPNEDTGAGPAVIDMSEDPTVLLQNYLVDKNIDPTIAMDVARLHGEGRVARKEIEQIPSLHGKQTEISELFRLYEAWKKTLVK
jgi:hypothetical protein